jgi:hypothetical protein
MRAFDPVEYETNEAGLLVPANVRGFKFGTPRDPTAPTIGPLQAAWSEVWLRRSFMPHQRYIADVTGELLPTGLPRYTLCVITLQRQSGKTALDLAQTGERCFTRPGFKAWYTAQKRKDARDQFLSFQDDVVAGTPLDQVVETLRGNGTEVMKFPRASQLRPFEPTEESVHGKQSDRMTFDEAWAHSKEFGEALLQAGSPTKLTRPGAQTFIFSAGGTAASTWLASLVARGRGGDPSMFYCELGIPDDADAEDLDVIAAHHPAYGYTVSHESLAGMRDDFEGDPSGWARAAGNRWTEVIGGSIDPKLWAAARYEGTVPDDAPVGYGAARSEDGTQVVIAAAALVDGIVVVEVLDVLPTAFGAAEHVKAWAVDGPVAIDPAGPSATIHDRLVSDDSLDSDQLLTMTGRDYSAACANLVDALQPRAFRFRPHPALDAAVRVAGKRQVGDGGYVWARVAAGAPIAALEAATLAAWAVEHRESDGIPLLDFGAA